MAKWTCTTEPELIPVLIDPKHHDQLLAEAAAILYNYFRSSQLKSEAKSIGSEVPQRRSSAEGVQAHAS